jgi:hypothetical protein
MPANRVPFTKRDLIIILSDGGSYEQEVVMESGNLAWSEGTPDALFFMDRGSIEDGETRDGDDAPMDLSFDFMLTDMASPAYATLAGWISRPAGSWEASNLISSLGVGRDFRLNVDVTFLGDRRGGVEDITLRFKHWKPKLSAAEGDGLTASVAGPCKSTQPERL